MIKTWEFSYAPCDKDTRRYKIRIDGEEEDLTSLIQKIGNVCGKPFIPLSKCFKWVFYVYNINKEEKQRIEDILREFCPNPLKSVKEGTTKGSVESEEEPSIGYILESIVSREFKEAKVEIPKEKEEGLKGKSSQIEKTKEVEKEEKVKKEKEEKDSKSDEVLSRLMEKNLLETEVNGKVGKIEPQEEEKKEVVEKVPEEREEEKPTEKSKVVPVMKVVKGEGFEKGNSFWQLKLNPLYTFDTFVVGTNSRFTHAAALAVAENPGKVYNPLFIYGGVGLGKTHLLHAIGNHAKNKNKNLRILYITTEKFIEDVIDAIRQGTVREFRNHCRMFDILLIDDIQFLAEAESTQEEFFHTFNILYDAQNQIVITSDKPPKKLVDLEERLKSRFEWGLTADIKSPNLETRVAILKKKEEQEEIKVNDDILLYIAGKLKSNIRELEGFLKRVSAYSQLTKQEINLETVKTLLGELLPPEEQEEEKKGEEEKKEEPVIGIGKEGEKKQEALLEKEVFSNKQVEPEKVEAEPELKKIEKIPLVEEIFPMTEDSSGEISIKGQTFKIVKVGYFYPQEYGEELKKIKKEFDAVIEKHKLKFLLKGIFEKEYPLQKKIDCNLFVELCKANKVKIAIVLGPPKGKQLKEGEFSSTLSALLFDEKISLQFIPFSDIGKQFRFLNLVLDIVLVSHENNK